jgi:hypothetical protein
MAQLKLNFVHLPNLPPGLSYNTTTSTFTPPSREEQAIVDTILACVMPLLTVQSFQN